MADTWGMEDARLCNQTKPNQTPQSHSKFKKLVINMSRMSLPVGRHAAFPSEVFMY